MCLSAEYAMFLLHNCNQLKLLNFIDITSNNKIVFKVKVVFLLISIRETLRASVLDIVEL